MKFMSLIALMLIASATGAAQAQSRDPYAVSDGRQRVANYYAYRNDVLENIRFIYSAKGCGVISNDAADGMRNFYLRPLYESPSLVTAVPGEIAKVGPLTRTAEQEGLARAQISGGCDWFNDNPDVVRVLREAAWRGVH
jgi:hypothetical protein